METAMPVTLKTSMPPLVMRGTHVSLFAGVSCASMLLKMLNVVVDREVAVELRRSVRDMARQIHPDLEFSVNNVDQIDDEVIDSWGRVSILTAGPPCEDFSPLLDLPPRHEGDKVGRQGLNGDRGRLFRVLIAVVKRVLRKHPGVIVIVENVMFEDLPDQWSEVCEGLGVRPVILDAADYSYTKRRRAYWVINLRIPDLSKAVKQMDGNECMDPGRTLIKTKRDSTGRPVAGTIGKSWIGDPPEAYTNMPVLVRDRKHVEPQHLRPHEAEKLMGWPEGVTCVSGATPAERLRAVGNGWNLHVTRLIFQELRVRLQTERVLECVRIKGVHSDRGFMQYVSHLVQVHAREGNARLAESLAQGTPAVSLEFVGILRRAFERERLIDSGASIHLDKNVVVEASQHRVRVAGFDGSQQVTEGRGYLPLNLTDLAGSKVPFDVEEVDKYAESVQPILSLGRLYKRGWRFEMDKGKGVCQAVLPDGSVVPLEIGGDNLLRMPSSIREDQERAQVAEELGGCPEDASCSQVWQQVEQAVRVAQERVPGLSTGVILEQCNYAPVISRKFRQADLTGDYLHRLFNHCDERKVAMTLKMTVGYEAKHYPRSEMGCEACQVGRARKAPVRSRRTMPLESASVVEALDWAWAVDQEEEVLNLGESHECLRPSAMPEADEAVAEQRRLKWQKEYDEAHVAVAQRGKAHGHRVMRRMNVSAMRPFEALFVDNKEVECFVRGGYEYMMVIVCYCTTAKFVVPIRRKTENGVALRKFVARHGVHKLPYKCTVYSDGCGSMAWAEDAATRCGLDHQYLPPHEPQLNLAEAAIDRIGEKARTIMVDTGAPDFMFLEAVLYVCCTALYMATDADRGYRTPVEMMTGVQPDITHVASASFLDCDGRDGAQAKAFSVTAEPQG